jgi:hypothetical protein
MRSRSSKPRASVRVPHDRAPNQVNGQINCSDLVPDAQRWYIVKTKGHV